MVFSAMLFVKTRVSGEADGLPATNGRTPSGNGYQLDFTTPGSFPWEAKFLKQIRQRPNFLI